MKKIASLVLTVVMFAAMLTVFSVPAFAMKDSSEFLTDRSDGEGAESTETEEDTSDNEDSDDVDGYIGSIPRPARIAPSNRSTPSSYYSPRERYREQVMAGEHGDNWSKENICTDETDEYKELLLCSMSEYTIDEGKTMTIKDSWKMDISCSLAINGVLNGTLTSFDITTFQTAISIGDNGRIDLDCSDESVAKALAEQLEAFGLSPKVTKNNVLVRKYPHCFYEGHNWNDSGYCTVCGIKNECNHQWVDGKCSVCKLECTHDWQYGKCKICGMDEAMYEVLQRLNSGSVLSEGSLTIIVGVACSVVFLAVGFFIGRKKKKPAVAEGAEDTDEE